jgi:RNA polymerase sigma factor (sigma-70 family)
MARPSPDACPGRELALEEQPGGGRLAPAEAPDAAVPTTVVSIVDARVAAGRREALVVEAFDAHAGRLKAFALAAVRDEAAADDLVQETFLRLVREVREGAPPDNVGAWLFRVCANLVTSRGRRRTVAERAKALLLEHGTHRSTEDRVIERDEHSRLAAALGRLPVDARLALLMAAAGIDSAKIGVAIGRSPGATRTLVCRSRVELRRIVEGMEARSR